MAGTPQFIDISAYQGQIDFTSYAAWSRQGDGIAHIAIKATEGTSFIDPLFAANRSAAIAAGIDVLILYHFGRPDIGNNAVSEAKFMHSVVGAIRPQDAIILDYEVSSPLATAEWAYQWLAQMEDSYDGKLPGIYASTAYIAQHLQDARLEPFALWEANWTFDPSKRPLVPSPWKTRFALQYTDNATNIPGISGTVDCNVYLGTEPTQEQQPMSIDLGTPGVSNFFKATSDPNVWQCIQTGFLVGHGILGFYQQFGGSGLNGITALGLPQSEESSVDGKPGVVRQVFERACVEWDPQKTDDNPPGSGNCYLTHWERDPRTIALQTENAQLKTLPNVTNLLAINTLASQIVQKSQVQ